MTQIISNYRGANRRLTPFESCAIADTIEKYRTGDKVVKI